MTLPASRSYSLFDPYGNPVPPVSSKIVVPLDGPGLPAR